MEEPDGLTTDEIAATWWAPRNATATRAAVVAETRRKELRATMHVVATARTAENHANATVVMGEIKAMHADATATARAEVTKEAEAYERRWRRPDIFALRRAGREHDFDQNCYSDVNRMTVKHSIPEDARQAMLYGEYCDIGDADAQAPAGAYSGADRLASWRGSPTPVPTPTVSPYPWRNVSPTPWYPTATPKP